MQAGEAEEPSMNRIASFASMGVLVWLVAVGVGCDGPARTSTARSLGEPPGGHQKMEKATFAAGCFWGVEAAFREIEGVVETQVGYIGGTTENPTYEQVCGHDTGHAEAVEVTYDPARVSYDDLLRVFWGCHDPTLVGRQGPDVGSQYRSAIFTHDPEQQAAAEASKQALDASGKLRRPIATEITPAPTFYRAEEYHQQYFEKRGGGSCHR
jgi:peptide-methionine (S)-S-oxide reductase